MPTSIFTDAAAVPVVTAVAVSLGIAGHTCCRWGGISGCRGSSSPGARRRVSRAAPPSWPSPAIAGPGRFFDALRADGWNVVETLAFADHHPFDRADIERMHAAARQCGAALILTTEKDMMRLLPSRPLPLPVAWVPLDVSWPAEQVRDIVEARLAEARRRGAAMSRVALAAIRERSLVSASLRHRLEYGVVASVAGVVCRLPQSVALRLGDAIGLAFHADRPSSSRVGPRQPRGLVSAQARRRSAPHRARRLQALRAPADRVAALRRPDARAETGARRVRRHRSGRRRACARARARCSSPATSGSGNCRRSRTA